MTDRKETIVDVLVVGAGLAGLVAARTLAKAGASVHIVEARDRVGGRTLTWQLDARGEERIAGEPRGFDLGATWCWPHQHRVRRLAAELGVDTYPQFRTGDAVYDAGEKQAAQRFPSPPPPYESLRFAGGAQRLGDRLAAELGAERQSLKTAVHAIEADAMGVRVAAKGATGERVGFRSRLVIVALPPRLALRKLRFAPDLPVDLRHAMEGTPTWMASAAKSVVVYARPFWREQGLSGLGISHAGPLGEVHDATTADGLQPALFGFFTRGTDSSLTPQARQAQVLRQLSRMFGPEAARPLHYVELDWAKEEHTSTPEDARALAEHPPYGNPLFRRPALDGRVYWAGSETAPHEGGYLEGAVASGEDAARGSLARL